ncbi:MAG TPA: DUF1801 domain-containing protein [Gemmatimonadales bacterium]|nr:DUF1801 domain-containing protein [Gemmatimonadales bacterium]
MKSKARSVQAYIAECPPESRKVLRALRALVKATAPRAIEKLSYGIPAFNLNGHYLVYIAGWKKHVSMYPVTGGVAREFKDELKPYRTGKGTLQFPLAQPMPKTLIRRIVKFRVDEVSGKDK